MIARAATLGFVLLAAWLPGRGTAPPPARLVRQGNALLQAGNVEAALAAYTQAETRTTDPGLVAFNKAVALYRLGQYREAELHLRQSSEDATGPRRARLLYDLASCLVQQARDRDADLLEEALRLYEQCLEHPGIDEALADDARHNLELAWALRERARAEPHRRDTTTSEKDDAGTRVRPPGPDEASTSPSQARARQGKTEPAGQEAGQGQPIQEDRLLRPGKGNLPPLPDDEQVAGLAADDAAEHVRQAAERIARERREHRQRRTALPSRHVKDW